jgi:formylglycine-generating enzyme required for sulfatase activity
MKREIQINRLSLILLSALIFSWPAQEVWSAETFRDCPDCPEMVSVPAGTFLVGSSDADTARDLQSVPGFARSNAPSYLAEEHPQHSVTIQQPLALGKYPVTRGEFAVFVRETGYSAEGPCETHAHHQFKLVADADWQKPGFTQTDHDPVVCVSWQDAHAYVVWLSEKIEKGSAAGAGPYRLPTEAEWEYAARAGTRTARWWGDSIGSGNAACDGCGSRWDRERTAPVGSFQPNGFGRYDVMGNVFQWTEDCWNKNYVGAPVDGTAWVTGDCERRVARGVDFESDAWLVRSAARFGLDIASQRYSFDYDVMKVRSTSYPGRYNYVGFVVSKKIS